MTFEQTSLDLLDVFESVTPTPARSRSGSRKQPPLIRCRCGRLHRSWNPHKVCNACVREQVSAARDEVAARVSAAMRRRRCPTPAEREQDRVVFAAIHARWLARQSLDHPWRVAVRGGEA